MNDKMLLEVCANSVESALAAQEGGAQRVELCRNLDVGGLTPFPGVIVKARKLLNIKLFVLIRPREGDFYYSRDEFEAMRQQIRFAREAGADGIVSGILLQDGRVDTERMKALLEAAGSLDFTFHRAIDTAPDLFTCVESILSLGIKRILTSGGKPTAPEGAMVIAEMVRRYRKDISFMPGSGISAENILDVARNTGAKEFHGSFRNQQSKPPPDVTSTTLVAKAVHHLSQL